MVLSVQRFKLYSKTNNHHHRRQEPLPAALQAFRSDISACITRLLFNLTPEFEISWVHQCFQLLPVANKAFAKLVVDIDYPVTNWQAKSMEDYLNYSLQVLDVLNSITGSISRLSHFRLSLLHALSLLPSNPTSAVAKLAAVAVAFGSPAKEIDRNEIKQGEEKAKERCCSDKESVVVQALIELRFIGLWVCRAVSAILSGDGKIHTISLREISISNPALVNLDSRVAETMAKGCFLKEVKELRDSSVFIVAGGNTGAMEKKLEQFETKMNELEKEVDRVFSQVLAARNELLNGIRFRK